MNALLITDVQNDFLPGGALEVPHGHKIIPVINELQQNFELVILTQDWHPAGHSSFASSHPGKKAFEQIQFDGMMQTLWPDHCVQGTHGAAFPPDLITRKAEAIFRKGTDPRIDSYSALFDNGHRKSTCVADYLRAKQVDRLYITGLCGDICVYFTAMDSLMEGFKTFIIEEGTCPLVARDFSMNMKTFESAGGKVLSTSEIPSYN